MISDGSYLLFREGFKWLLIPSKRLKTRQEIHSEIYNAHFDKNLSITLLIQSTVNQLCIKFIEEEIEK